MPTTLLNGVRLYWERHGESGPALVFVHGSWGDHHNWDPVVPALARSFRVFTYDRRGHSQSERPGAQGCLEEDVADLAALIRENDLAPAHVVGNSFGAAIALRLAAAQAHLFATLTAHEPPLLGLLENDPVLPPILDRLGAVVRTLQAGQAELGAQQFVDTVALGPGAWQTLAPGMRETFVFNAPTFLDETQDPGGLHRVDLTRLAAFDHPALLTRGALSPPFFARILDQVAGALPRARRYTFAEGGHVPHLTCPDEYVEVLKGFVRAA